MRVENTDYELSLDLGKINHQVNYNLNLAFSNLLMV